MGGDTDVLYIWTTMAKLGSGIIATGQALHTVAHGLRLCAGNQAAHAFAGLSKEMEDPDPDPDPLSWIEECPPILFLIVQSDDN
nr:hypothetical protein CFP56_68821 [Quercus suber]